MKETPEPNLVETEYGWALASPTPPGRRDLYWKKTPENHVYFWDGDGWFRLQPPDRLPLKDQELPHG